MAILIPTVCATYGDATTTEGGPFCEYVLAQFRSDANLTWVGETRSALNVDELKWKAIKGERPRLKSNEDFWSAIRAGVREATIIVVDPKPLQTKVRLGFLADGAAEGHDFDLSDIIDGCATAMVADTPIACLPSELARVFGRYPMKLYGAFDDFTPDALRKRVGPGLRDARVLAARAHATFDLPGVNDGSTRDLFRLPTARAAMKQLLSTSRHFDEEHAKSAAVLNEASDIIAESLEDAYNGTYCLADGSVVGYGAVTTSGTVTAAWSVGTSPISLAKKPLVTECGSTSIDHLQAADIAAGWAREMLETGDTRALARFFRRVLVNGAVVPE
jgi:hypothetical protein